MYFESHQTEDHHREEHYRTLEGICAKFCLKLLSESN